jgi:hypothetical protein
MTSLLEIKEALAELTPAELAELAAFIQAPANPVTEREIDMDFSPANKQSVPLPEIDPEIDHDFDGGEASPLS